MTNEEFAQALEHGAPGTAWLYYGDGESLDGLEWPEGTPAPTWDDVTAWRAELDASPPAPEPSTGEKIAAALDVVQRDPALAVATKQALAAMVAALAPPAQ